MGKCNFTIDGQNIQAETGQTILQAARQEGIIFLSYVITLHCPRKAPAGSAWWKSKDSEPCIQPVLIQYLKG